MPTPAPTSPMKKTAAIRRAREVVQPPRSSHPPHFIVRVPCDVRQVDSALVEVTAKDYLEAQHIRSYSISRIALALMGLQDVPLTPEDGGTIDQLMDKALYRATHDRDAVPPLGFWQVRLIGGADAQDDAAANDRRQA